MSNRTKRGAVLLAWLVPVAAAADISAPVETASWYYAIGGGDPIAKAISTPGTLTLGGSAALSLGYSCGKFDPLASITAQFSDVADSIQSALVGAASGLLSALPMYLLQRASPALFELFQGFTIDIKETFDLSYKSCEEYEQQILAGGDPYAGWIAMAKGTAWKTEMSTTNNAIEARENVDEAAGDKGLPWITGYGAGAGQDPIHATRDPVRAGYNVALGQSPGTPPGPFTGPDTPRLVTLFSTSAEASEWAVDVLGDAIIRTCDGCVREQIPGKGLATKFTSEQDEVAGHVSVLMAGTATPEFSELAEIEAPGVAVSARVIDALRALPPDEQAVMGGRLASEIALTRTIERALAVRRLMLASRRIPEIASNNEAISHLNTIINELEREVDQFLYESRVRKEITTNTAAALIRRENARLAEGAAVPQHAEPEQTHFGDGGRL